MSPILPTVRGLATGYRYGVRPFASTVGARVRVQVTNSHLQPLHSQDTAFTADDAEQLGVLLIQAAAVARIEHARLLTEAA